MKTKRLNPLDASWLYVESDETPMHVGGLLTFELPEGAPKDFCLQMVEEFKTFGDIYPPWNQKLKSTRLKNPIHRWIEDEKMDIDYHLRHSALPAPGGERELGVLASRLHSHPLDFRRPPWECHIIEGLDNNRFALYIKIHHSLIDGVAGMRLLARALASDPADIHRPPFWAIPPRERKPQAEGAKKLASFFENISDAISGTLDGVRHQADNVPELFKVASNMVKAARTPNDPMGLPFDAPNSILNGRIHGQRRYATQLYTVTRLKTLAKAADCTLNDIVLAICAGALRRFLLEADALPEKPLTAGIPVSVRPKGDEETGNAITFIIASLGTDIADPAERLAEIKASTQSAKENLKQLSADAMMQYTMALMAPYIGSLITGVGGRTRPVFNLTISNVPGPQQDLYVHGARMEAFYPTSLITHGQALNITIHGHADTLGFGFIGCRDTLPSMQNIAVYTGEALEELEGIFLKKPK
jgi:diacylglycerol O-acyltransferase